MCKVQGSDDTCIVYHQYNQSYVIEWHHVTVVAYRLCMVIEVTKLWADLTLNVAFLLHFSIAVCWCTVRHACNFLTALALLESISFSSIELIELIFCIPLMWQTCLKCCMSLCCLCHWGHVTGYEAMWLPITSNFLLMWHFHWFH